MGRLEGKVALVTGAARGQGAAEARLFAAEGARVVLADVLEEQGRSVAAEIGEAAEFTSLDVTQEAAWEQLVAGVERRFGRLDVLVNNAAITRFAPLLETTTSDYLDVIRVNQLGCFLGIRIGGAAMARAGAGSIVNISSIGGLEGVPTSIAYCASKHALVGMTKTAAIELAPMGVRVNAVHPGGVITDMLPLTEQEREHIRREGMPNVPLGRLAEPEDIARVALFLASDDSAYCNGSSFVVDGGMTAGPMSLF
jgi:3alpha(or 20beta)-hydroxysteroid dehydrogenase